MSVQRKLDQNIQYTWVEIWLVLIYIMLHFNAAIMKITYASCLYKGLKCIFKQFSSIESCIH